MDFFFKTASFCFIFSLIAFELRRSVKSNREHVGGLLKMFAIALVFSYLIDLTKWLILMAVSFFIE